MDIHGVINRIIKFLFKGEVRCPGESMLLQDKNSNILIYGVNFWFDTNIIIKIEISIKRGFFT